MKKQSSPVLMIIAIAAALLLGACGSGGGDGTPQQTSVRLARTGQTVCYDAAGAVVACAGTGQDGDKLAGVAWPSPRFTNPDGTTPVTGSVVVDQLTGLMWLRNANCMQTRDAANPGAEFDNDGTVGDGQVSWSHALDFIKGINNGTYAECAAGYNDWRLPNRTELRSLVDYSAHLPAVQSGHPFTSIQAADLQGGYYLWTSTTFAGDTTVVWFVVLNDGRSVYGSKTNNFHAWPVRSGQ